MHDKGDRRLRGHSVIMCALLLYWDIERPISFAFLLVARFTRAGGFNMYCMQYPALSPQVCALAFMDR